MGYIAICDMIIIHNVAQLLPFDMLRNDAIHDTRQHDILQCSLL